MNVTCGEILLSEAAERYLEAQGRLLSIVETLCNMFGWLQAFVTDLLPSGDHLPMQLLDRRR